MRTRLRDGAQKKNRNTQKTGLCKHGNLVNCIPTPHPPNITNTKDAQLSISLRTDSVFCILNETRPVRDLFSVQNTHFSFFFLFFLPWLSGRKHCGGSQCHNVKERVGLGGKKKQMLNESAQLCC